MKKYKFKVCKHCDKEIQDKHLVTFTLVKQTLDAFSTEAWEAGINNGHLEIGWEKETSTYYHIECLQELAGKEFIKDNVSTEFSEEDFRKMNILAGL